MAIDTTTSSLDNNAQIVLGLLSKFRSIDLQQRLTADDLNVGSASSDSPYEVFQDSVAALEQYKLVAPPNHRIQIDAILGHIDTELTVRGIDPSNFKNGTDGTRAPDFDDLDRKLKFIIDSNAVADRFEQLSSFGNVLNSVGIDLPTLRMEFESGRNPLLASDIQNKIIGAVDELQIKIALQKNEVASIASSNANRGLDDEIKKIIDSLNASADNLNKISSAFDKNNPNSTSDLEALKDEFQNGPSKRSQQDAEAIGIDLINLGDGSKSLGTAYERLRLLGVTDDYIVEVALANKNEQERYISWNIPLAEEVKEKFRHFKNALKTNNVELKETPEYQKANELFGHIPHDANICSLVDVWVKEAIDEVNTRVAAIDKTFANTFVPNEDGVLEENPDAAFALMGLQRPNNTENWPYAKDSYESTIGFFETELVKRLFDNDALVGSGFLKKLDTIDTVTTLIDDTQLIPGLNKIYDIINQRVSEHEAKLSKDDQLSAEKRASDIKDFRIQQYQYELQELTPYQHKKFSEVATNPNNLDKFLTLLNIYKSSVCLGTLVDPHWNNPSLTAEQSSIQIAKQNQAELMLKEFYLTQQRQHARSHVLGKLDSRIELEKANFKRQMDKMTTPYARLKRSLKRIGYKINTLVGAGLWVTYRLSGTFGVGAGLLAAAVSIPFAAPTLVVSFLAISLYMYGISWVVKPALKHAKAIATEGSAYEQDLLNIKLESQKQLLKESTEDIDRLLSTYIMVAEELIDKFEPGETPRNRHIRHFFRKVLSAHGIIEPTGENRGIVREDVGDVPYFCLINSVIIRGWGSISDSDYDIVKKTIKKNGFEDESGEKAWIKFIEYYGNPEDGVKGSNYLRENLPIPDSLKGFARRIAQSTIDIEDLQLSDLAKAEQNWFCDDPKKVVGYLNSLRIQPDVTAYMTTIKKISGDIQEKLPAKFGEKEGRISQLNRKQSVLNFGQHLLATLELPESGGRSGKK